MRVLPAANHPALKSVSIGPCVSREIQWSVRHRHERVESFSIVKETDVPPPAVGTLPDPVQPRQTVRVSSDAGGGVADAVTRAPHE